MLRGFAAAAVAVCLGMTGFGAAAAIVPPLKFQTGVEFGISNAELDVLMKTLFDEHPEFDAIDPNFGKRNIGIGVVDLNGDGVDEHLVQVISSSTCMFGCVTYVFQLRDSKWTRIGAISTGTVLILPDTTPGATYSLIQGEYSQLRWNGVGYGGFCHEVGVCEPAGR